MQVYNHTRKLFTNGEVAIASLKVMLVNNYTFDAAQTVMTAIEANEVSGNGWAVGGVDIAGAVVTSVATDASMLDATDISVTASGGDIGPASGMVIYDSTVNDYPLFYYELALLKQQVMVLRFLSPGTPMVFTGLLHLLKVSNAVNF